jgi:hypothetical protein
MKLVIVLIITAIAYVLVMLGNDVFAHDQSLAEAVKGSPHQFVHSLGELAALAWQYKVVTLIAVGIAVAVALVRPVPPVKNQAQRR